MYHTKIITAILALTAASGFCRAEDAAPSKVYKLDFVIKEVDGSKVLNSRAYSLITPAGSAYGSIRVGTKVPFASAKQTGQGQPFATTEYQQIDVGVNIDIRDVKESQNRVSFKISAEVSSIPTGSTSETNPVIRQNRWSSEVSVPVKKPTTLFSSDNLDTKSQLQVEVTATPIP